MRVVTGHCIVRSCVRRYTLLATLSVVGLLLKYSKCLASIFSQFLLSLYCRVVLSSSGSCPLLLRPLQFCLAVHCLLVIENASLLSVVCTLLLRSPQFCFAVHCLLVIERALLLLRDYGQTLLVVRLVSRAAFAHPLHFRLLEALDLVRARGVGLCVHPLG